MEKLPQINVQGIVENPKMCLVCFDDLNNENSLEYQSANDSIYWFPAYFCSDCTGALQDIQFFKYCNDLANTTCAKQQRILLERGLPINVRDKNAFPMSGDKEIMKLRRAADKQEISAKLLGALEGEERLKFWEQQKLFIIQNEEGIE